MENKLLHSLCKSSYIIAVVVALLTSFARGEEVPALYDVELPVDSQQNRELNKASKLALRTVLIRVSGSRQLEQNSKIQRVITNAQQLVKQFQYRRQVDAATQKEQLTVLIEFEKTLVDEALRSAGLSLWAANRPTVLLWLTVEDVNGRRFASEESDPNIIKWIIHYARQRGLMVKFPLFDLQDTLAVEPDEAWNLSNWRVQEAVKRYDTDTVLLGKFSQLSNGQLFGKWLYQYDSKQKNYDAQSSSLEEYLGAGLNQIADLMASKYAVAPIDVADNGVLMRLTGIDDYGDYAKAIAYLESVAAIRHANVVKIAGDEIIIHLIADGLLSQLQQVFLLDNRVVAMTESSYRGGYNIVLDYQWPF